MNFDKARKHLKQGSLITRRVWEDKGIFVFSIQKNKANTEHLKQVMPAEIVRSLAPGYCVEETLFMRTARGGLIPGWKPTSHMREENDWVVHRHADYKRPTCATESRPGRQQQIVTSDYKPGVNQRYKTDEWSVGDLWSALRTAIAPDRSLGGD